MRSAEQAPHSSSLLVGSGSSAPSSAMVDDPLPILLVFGSETNDENR